MLQHLTIRYTDMSTARNVRRMSVWIRRLLRRSSLKSLILLNDQSYRTAPAFDGLIWHVVDRHHETITVLSLPTAFVRQRTLQVLCSTCVRLEELAVAIHPNVLVGSRR